MSKSRGQAGETSSTTPVAPLAPLHVITGKGGTGKTTIAAALGIALATGGARVLVVEVEGRNGLAEIFDSSQIKSTPKHVASAPGGGSVYAMSVDPEAVLLEKLSTLTKLPGSEAVLRKAGAIDFAISIAPGVRDVLLLGRTCAATMPDDGEGSADPMTFDAVVLDAPPTGRVIRFLTSGADLSAIAKVGSVNDQAAKVDRIVRSNSTHIHLVTLLEEMPVQETLDCDKELSEHALPSGALVVNLAQPRLLSKALAADLKLGKVGTTTIAEQLTKAGLPAKSASTDFADDLLFAASVFEAKSANAAELEHLLDECERPTARVERLADGVSRAGLARLGEIVHGQLDVFNRSAEVKQA